MQTNTYKKSNYSFFIDKEDGTYIIYSSLTGFIMKVIDQNYLLYIEKILNSDEIEIENNDFFDLLIKKRILIPIEDNDLLYAKTIYEEKIVKSKCLEIMIVITKQCNFRCVYCGQKHESRKTISSEKLITISNIIEKMICENKYNELKISFFGGEPLLEYKKIIDFLELVKQQSIKYNFIYSAGMSTNGYLLTLSRLKKLSSLNCFNYQISIDGLANVHDKKRPLKNGNGTWDIIIKNIISAINTNLNFHMIIRTNFNYEVAESIINFYDYFKNKLNDKRVVIYFENIKNQGNINTPEIISDYESMCIDFELVNILKNKNISCLNAYERLMPCGLICYASRPNYFIFDSEGNIMKCSLDFDMEDNKIGTITDNQEFNINYNKYIKWVYNDYQFSIKCQKCKILPLCFGKKCPKNFSIYGYSESCNLDLLYNDIEGIIRNYY